MLNVSISNLSLEQLKQAVQLKEQIAGLEAQLADILSGISTAAPAFTFPTVTTAAPRTSGGRRQMSPEARARIAAAQRARWAKFRGDTGSAAKPAKTRGPGGMSAEGRERIAAAQRARWAKGTVPRRLLPKKNGLSPAGRARLIAAQKARWARFRAQKGK
jgi:hypothetical protein